jgi:hypothetical protein
MQDFIHLKRSIFGEAHLLHEAGYIILYVGNLREEKSSRRMLEFPTAI